MGERLKMRLARSGRRVKQNLDSSLHADCDEPIKPWSGESYANRIGRSGV